MLKTFIVLFIIGLGIAIGLIYSKQIKKSVSSVANAPVAEQMQDAATEVKENVQEAMSEDTTAAAPVAMQATTTTQK